MRHATSQRTATPGACMCNSCCCTQCIYVVTYACLVFLPVHLQTGNRFGPLVAHMSSGLQNGDLSLAVQATFKVHCPPTHPPKFGGRPSCMHHCYHHKVVGVLALPGFTPEAQGHMWIFTNGMHKSLLTDHNSMCKSCLRKRHSNLWDLPAGFDITSGCPPPTWRVSLSKSSMSVRLMCAALATRCT